MPGHFCSGGHDLYSQTGRVALADSVIPGRREDASFNRSIGLSPGAGGRRGADGANTRTGAGLLTITGTEAGPLCGATDGISIVDGRLTAVDGALVAAAGYVLVEFIR
jgi:hypothetical protein